MTPEQITAVAEEVWKYKCEGVGKNRYWFSQYDENLWLHCEHIAGHVISWSGFGRTVEAMAGKKMDLIQGFPFMSLMRCKITKEEFWERVHLAALEAVRGK